MDDALQSTIVRAAMELVIDIRTFLADLFWSIKNEGRLSGCQGIDGKDDLEKQNRILRRTPTRHSMRLIPSQYQCHKEKSRTFHYSQARLPPRFFEARKETTQQKTAPST